jgi:hypothetical protein
VNSTAGEGDYTATTKFGVTPKRYNGTSGDIRVGGNSDNPNFQTNSGGTAVTQGSTYLVLFKVENLIASGAAPATTQVVEYGSDLTGWTQVAIPATSAGIVTITPGSPADRVKVTIPNQGNQLFVRLKVSQ